MQVHIEAESKTADHCRKYALGDEDCDHTHRSMSTMFEFGGVSRWNLKDCGRLKLGK
jgi:hypothetical protein